MQLLGLTQLLGLLLLLAPPSSAQSPPPVFLKPSVEKESRYRGEPITLSLRDADLVETLRSFSRFGKFNLILDPAISGKVTLEFKDVPWDQALDQILKVHGLGLEISGGKVLVAPPGVLEERRQRLRAVRTVRLDLVHVRAEAVARCLAQTEAGILTPEGRAQFSAGNQLVLRDRASRLLDIGRLLAKLDYPGAEDESMEDLIHRCTTTWKSLDAGQRLKAPSPGTP